MALVNKQELFDVIIDRVNEVSMLEGLKKHQGFPRWFASMYYLDPQGMFASDGSHDGKVDFFFTTNDGKTVKHHVINSKFTETYNKLAPPAFYEEIAYFSQIFKNSDQRDNFLSNAVKPELRSRYTLLFDRHDEGEAELVFITNCRRNDKYLTLLENSIVKVFHLEDLVQHLIDDLDATMPRTPDLALDDIHTVLSADKRDTSVSTSIVFARLVDFINYMKKDPYDLLFARNVRVSFGVKKNSVNSEIRDTFVNHPEEFVFSNNGITILCEDHEHKLGSNRLVLVNPRVVNGSQTLHSIRDVVKPSSQARVMVRIIEIPPIKGDNIEDQIEKKRDTLNKISVRSNRQNPIKKWDLVSNDDFQLEIYRFFRRKGWFYERRIREWNQRSRELKSVGIKRGINIKTLAQYIVSYYWNKPKMGPSVAKIAAGELFEGQVYEQIQKTSPELAYQIFQVSDNLKYSLRDLASNRTVDALRANAYLVLFALVVRTFQETGIKWGESNFTDLLDDHADDWQGTRDKLWRAMIKEAIKHINGVYQADVKRAKRHKEEVPSIRNYFINHKSVAQLMNKPLPTKLKQTVKRVLSG